MKKKVLGCFSFGFNFNFLLNVLHRRRHPNPTIEALVHVVSSFLLYSTTNIQRN